MTGKGSPRKGPAVGFIFEPELVLGGQRLTTPVYYAEQSFEKRGAPRSSCILSTLTRVGVLISNFSPIALIPSGFAAILL